MKRKGTIFHVWLSVSIWCVAVLRCDAQLELTARWAASSTVGEDLSGKGNHMTLGTFTTGYDSYLGTDIQAASPSSASCLSFSNPSMLLSNDPIITFFYRIEVKDYGKRQTLVSWGTGAKYLRVFVEMLDSETQSLGIETNTGSEFKVDMKLSSFNTLGVWNSGLVYAKGGTLHAQSAGFTASLSIPGSMSSSDTFSFMCAGFPAIANHMMLSGGMFDVKYYTGLAYPCVDGFYNGKCLELKASCATPAVLRPGRSDDVFYSTMDIDLQFLIDLKKVGGQWETAGGVALPAGATVWCGDAAHDLSGGSYYTNAGAGNSAGVRPQGALCAGYEYQEGPGLIDMACGADDYLCTTTLVAEVDDPTATAVTPAPPTPAPATLPPPTVVPTPAPPTAAPPTSAPPTSAPLTNAPPTLSPPTSAPPTVAPPTSAPPTSAPPTSAPLTNAPPTLSPPTSAPLTVAPPTVAPPTVAPPTSPPLTIAPPTLSPPTPAPLTSAPLTAAPLTAAPPTSAPPTSAPPTVSPLTPAPATLTPVTFTPPVLPTAVPDTSPPKTFPPWTSAPATGLPLTAQPATLPPATTLAPGTPTPATLPPASTATQPPQTAPPAQVTLVPETPFPATPLPTAPSAAPALTLPPASPTPAGFATPTPPGTPAPGGFATPLPTAAQTAAPQTQPTTTAATAAPNTPTPPDTEAPSMAVGTGAPTALPSATTGPTPAPLPESLTPATIVPWVEPEPGVVGADLEVTQSPISPGAEKLAESGVVLAGVASVGALAGAGAPGAVRLGLMSARCEVGTQSTRLSRIMNPTGLVVDDSEAMGAVVGNLAIVLGATLICLAAMQLAKILGPRIFPTFFDGLDVQGFLRVPSAPIFVFFVVYQGTTLGAMRILIIARSPVHVLVGIIVTCMGLMLPYMLFKLMHRNVPKRATYHLVQKRAYPIEFVLGPGEWVNTGRKYMWSQRYICMLLPYRKGCAWFSCLELCASLALSAIQSTRPESQLGCAYMKSAQGAVILVVMLLEMFLRPSARMRDTVLLSISTAMQVAAMAFHTLAHYEDNTLGWHYTFGTTLLVAAGAILLIKMLLDFLTEVYVLITRRRDQAQKDFYKRQSQINQLPSFYDYEADEELGAAFNSTLPMATSLTPLTPVETPKERPLSTEIFTPKSSSTSLSGRDQNVGNAWVTRSSRVRSLSFGNNPPLSLACVASSMDSLGSHVYSPSASDRRRSARSRAGTTNLSPRRSSTSLTADVMSTTPKTKGIVPTSPNGLRVLF